MSQLFQPLSLRQLTLPNRIVADVPVLGQGRNGQ